MKNKMLSFLIAAHNEEKMIGRVLDNLISIPYPNYEIILGLDGCTDETENIVKSYCKKSSKIRYYNLSLRQGKPAVIDKIIRQASGEIIIIQDADWIFNVKDGKSLKKFIEVFDNPKIGGIAESYPIQYPLRSDAGILEQGIMLQNSVWLDYLKQAGKKIDDNWVLADKKSHPLLVNILRKKLYKSNKTLGDDFERFRDIISAKKDVLIINKPSMPRMITIGEKYRFRDIIKQKERTAIARRQLAENPVGKRFYSFNFLFYVLKRAIKMNFKEKFAFFLISLAFLIGTLKSKLNNKISTREGWNLRLRR